MSTYQHVVICGNLGQDPDVRYMPSGTAVCNLSVATTEKWKERETGNDKERTEWHRVSLFGRTAEVAGEYLRKGSKVLIEGKLQTRKWQDREGTDRYTTEIRADRMVMLDGAGRSKPGQPAAGPKRAKGQLPEGYDSGGATDDFEDSIPF